MTRTPTVNTSTVAISVARSLLHAIVAAALVDVVGVVAVVAVVVAVVAIVVLVALVDLVAVVAVVAVVVAVAEVTERLADASGSVLQMLMDLK